jgi:cytochrome P450
LRAGLETTASVLAVLFCDLAKHQDVQNRCRAEVLEVLGHRAPTHEDLKELKCVARCFPGGVFSGLSFITIRYMTAVIKEAMRIDPAITAFNRLLDEDITFQVPTASFSFFAAFFLTKNFVGRA